MLTERFYQLLSRKMAGEATIQELDELNKLMQENEEWKNLAIQLSVQQTSDTETDDEESEAAFAAHSVKMLVRTKTSDGQMSGRIDDSNKNETTPILPLRKTLSPVIKWTMRIAAVLVVAIGGIFTFRYFTYQNPAAVATNEIATKKGSTSQVTLPDGTKVWLNSDSKITYSKDFGSNVREVSLTGEAFFDVLHDDKKPFIIHAGTMNITDLGTAFDVKYYPLDKTIETSLIRGKIEVTFSDKADKYILHPNDKLVMRNNQAQITNSNMSTPKIEIDNINRSPDSVVYETAWMQRKLAFNNETLESIAHSLERRFDVTIVFKDDEVKYYPYTAIYEDESLDKILEYLSLSKHFEYKTNGKTITIGK
jgi:ferric-dicitrate binding protein FerR (iron transport regulator)